MSNEDSKLSPGQTLSFQQFVESVVMTTEQVWRLKELSTAQPPKYVRRQLAPEAAKGRLFPFVDEKGEPSKEYVERVALEAEIIAAVRTQMSTGLYEGSGRKRSGYQRQYLETNHWSSVPIDLRNWTVGGGEGLLIDVEITSAKRPSNDDLLVQSVVNCLSALRASATTKRDVKELVTLEAAYSITTHMFERAWERALEYLPSKEREAWTKAGPRRNRN